jgi:outer membrane receptor for Fe3+-dicitrate
MGLTPQGGLINFVTKSIPVTPTFSTTNTFGSFNLFQSNNYYGGRFGNLGAQMGYMRQQSDGFRQHSASQVDDFTLRLESNPDDKTQIRMCTGTTRLRRPRAESLPHNSRPM